MRWPAHRCEAFILCGGDSRRMGYPKEMLRVDGEPLAARLLERLREAFERVSLVTSRPAFLRHCVDAPIHTDSFRKAGPLAGLHAGLRAASSPWGFFLACDMPAVHNDLIRSLLQTALATDRPAVVPRAAGRRQPLCAVYSRALLPEIEHRLRDPGDRSVNSFLDAVQPEIVDVPESASVQFRDLDEPDDLHLLRRLYQDVEPLPVAEHALAGGQRTTDAVAEEWPVAVYVNGARLVTVLCLPTALRELGAGLAAYLGLAQDRTDIRRLEPDYHARRVEMELDASDDDIRRATMLLVTSTCGANVYGAQAPSYEGTELPAGFRAARSHILECVRAMRSMAPAFSVTGATHQAAFSDGKQIRLLFEDIGRHNALDKVIGRALLTGADLSRGLIVSTGRLSSEMVVKAVRRRVPILASKSAVTTNAIRLAQKHGLTLVGFARGDRLNVYTGKERVRDA